MYMLGLFANMNKKKKKKKKTELSIQGIIFDIKKYTVELIYNNIFETRHICKATHVLCRCYTKW
jgi:hypothetical protein